MMKTEKERHDGRPRREGGYRCGLIAKIGTTKESPAPESTQCRCRKAEGSRLRGRHCGQYYERGRGHYLRRFTSRSRTAGKDYESRAMIRRGRKGEGWREEEAARQQFSRVGWCLHKDNFAGTSRRKFSIKESGLGGTSQEG